MQLCNLQSQWGQLLIFYFQKKTIPIKLTNTQIPKNILLNLVVTKPRNKWLKARINIKLQLTGIGYYNHFTETTNPSKKSFGKVTKRNIPNVFEKRT